MLATQNQLLAALPPPDFERLLPFLEQVPLESGCAIFEHGSQQAYVYFPVAGDVSLQRVNVDASLAEIAVVGNEGVVGVAQSGYDRGSPFGNNIPGRHLSNHPTQLEIQSHALHLYVVGRDRPTTYRSTFRLRPQPRCNRKRRDCAPCLPIKQGVELRYVPPSLCA